MADKLKELMPDKAFKLFMDELEKITTNRKSCDQGYRENTKAFELIYAGKAI